MNVEQLEKRVAALEKEMVKLKEQMKNGQDEKVPWWIRQGGSFKDDPVFDEIVRLGREYRQSLHPDYKKKPKKLKVKKKK